MVRTIREVCSPYLHKSHFLQYTGIQHLLKVAQIEPIRLADLDRSMVHPAISTFAHAQSVRADVLRAVAIALLDALALPAFDRFLGRTRS